MDELTQRKMRTCQHPHMGGICGAPAEYRDRILNRDLCKFHGLLLTSIERRVYKLSPTGCVDDKVAKFPSRSLGFTQR